MSTKRNGSTMPQRFGPEPRTVEFSSGVTGYITPLEVETLRMVEEWRDRECPLPDPPVEEVETLGGGKESMPVGQDAPEHKTYLQARRRVELDRAALWTDFIIEHCLVIEGAEDEAGKATLVQAFAHRRKIAEATGVSFDGTDWEITLRHFILAGPDDYTLLNLNARDLQFPHITQEELAKRINSFRPFLERAAAADS